jgi:hypothetical protein
LPAASSHREKPDLNKEKKSLNQFDNDNMGCKMNCKMQHKCAYNEKREVTLQSIADAVCYISSTLTVSVFIYYDQSLTSDVIKFVYLMIECLLLLSDQVIACKAAIRKTDRNIEFLGNKWGVSKSCVDRISYHTGRISIIKYGKPS